MEPQKTHIYLMPGLAASPKIFEYVQLSTTQFEVHYLEWILPVSVSETLEAYAKRMAEFVKGMSSSGIIIPIVPF